MKKPQSVRLISLGCPKNLVDSEVMLGILKKKGWVPSAGEKADVVIVNTCSFIREAKEESIETILRLAQAKERGKCGRLVVAGCLPQRYGKELAREMPEVDLFLGTGEFHRIGELLSNAGSGEKEERTFIRPPQYLYDHRTPRLFSSSPGTVYVKVSEGCSHACSYCVIPRVRGKLRSRTISSVVKEAEQAAAGGVKEINLLAQDLTAYGADRGDGTHLVALLEKLVRVKGLRWIRLLYLHPARVTPELLKVVRGEEKICRYLDIPLQHADPWMLRAMNRPAGRRGALELVNWVRQEIPGAVLRTSLMVGFPGETERRFQALLDFVKQARLDHLGVFRYSREEGTPAAARRGQVSEEEKARRFHEVMHLQKSISLRNQKTRIGSRVVVLVEKKGTSPQRSGEGRTAGQAPEVDGKTFLTGGNPQPGEMVPARIIRAGAYDFYAEIQERGDPG